MEQMKQTKDMSPTILLVERDDDTRPILKKNLHNWGYHVLVAIEEEEAIALARGGRERPSLILLNQVQLSVDEFLNMGRRICESAELPKNTPVVVTAEQYGEDMEGKDVRVGDSHYISYLEDGKQLINLLHRLCPILTQAD